MPDSAILVFNGGSSSIKFSIYAAEGGSPNLLYDGEASGIGTSEAQFNFFAVQHGVRQQTISETTPSTLGSFGDAVGKIASVLQQPGMPSPAAIGHRVVHSGPKLDAHQRITPEVLADIEQAASFAPLHQPIALEILHESMRHFRGVENYACFDTVFHQSMPEVASTYPLPKEIRDRGVRRYGFHGISCESVVQQFRDGFSAESQHHGGIPARLIIAHLGSGASVTAVRDGKSFDTTMGLTPCGGVLMGTRPGDLDPGVIFYLLRAQSAGTATATDAIEQMLNRHSGMLALSGLSNDMRLLRDAANHGNSQAALAIEAFVWSVKKTVGGYIALMGGADAVVFTGGIGEHDASTRSAICAGLEAFGVMLDTAKNEGTQSGARSIHREASGTAVYVLPAEEDRVIAAHVARLAAER